MKFLLLFLLFLPAQNSWAQSGTENCFSKNIIFGNAGGLDSLTGLLVDGLPKKGFYMVGESHTFLANNDFQFALIKALHKNGVYNVANELPHATCFLFNQYLETGNDSLLQLLKPAATYSLLQKVRAYNMSLPANEQVRYYGIDYLDADYDYDNFYSSLQIIRKNIPSGNLPLDIFIDRQLQKNKWVKNDIIALNDTLFLQLQADSVQYKKHFGRYYNDLLLMASNMIGYRPNRDGDIYKSFQLLYRQLLTEEKEPPKFLAFYGGGHLYNLGDKLLLKNTSPIKDNICRIDIQYIHCIGGFNTGKYLDNTSYNLNKKTAKELVVFCRKNSWKVGVLPDVKCLNFKNKRPDAVIIFNDYGNRKMNSWKFD